MATRASTAISINTAVTLPATITSGVLNPTQTNLGGTTPASWGALVLELAITNSSVPPTKGIEITVNYAFSDIISSNPTGSTYPIVFTTSNSFTTYTIPVASLQWTINSGAIPILGDYLYTWIELNDNLIQPVTASLLATQCTFVTSQIYQT